MDQDKTMTAKLLTATLKKDEDFVLLKIVGNITHENIDEFKKDLSDASKVLSDAHIELGHKLKILLDVSDFTGTYNAEALTALADFARKDEPIVDKTASFGGTDKVKMAGEAAIALSHRTNIQIFDTEEEARAWLLA